MKYALIVAGGSGKRMNHSLPKQFIQLEDKPILYHTIRKFVACMPDINIILVLPVEYLDQQEFLQSCFPDNIQVNLIGGGETRFHSVRNGLNAINDEGIVFIHDAVRPFVTSTVIDQCHETALQHGNAIPCIELKESLRKVTALGNEALDRKDYKIIQTPQTFQVSMIKKAYEIDYEDHFTDDASVFEFSGHSICLIQGNEENIKITTPQDLATAGFLLLQERPLA